MNAPKASAREQKLANKFELYWEQTVLLCPCSLIYCFASLAWWQVLVSSLKQYSCPCFEGMSISFHLSPPLKHFLSFPCNLFWPLRSSAVQTPLGTKCCPAFLLQTKRCDYAIPNLPTPMCVDSHSKPPFFAPKTVAGLFQPAFLHPLCFPAYFCAMAWATRQKKELCDRLLLSEGRKCCSNSSEGCRTPRGLKWWI